MFNSIERSGVNKRLLISALVMLFILSAPAFAWPPIPTPTPNDFAERWIIQRTVDKEEANLTEIFDEGKDRVISAGFLQRLLTNSVDNVKVSNRGIGIYNAVIVGDLDLRNDEIPYSVSLINCSFKGEVIFRNAHIKGELVLDGSEFQRFVDFQDINVDGDLMVRQAVIRNGADFVGARIGAYLIFEGTQFKGTEEVLFINTRVEGILICTKAVFDGSTWFSRMYVKSNAEFNETIFNGFVTFDSAEVDKDFQANNAQFKGTDVKVQFYNIKIADSVTLNDAKFAGGFAFTRADIGGNLELVNTQATNPDMEKTFTGMKVNSINIENTNIAPPFHLHAMDYRLIWHADGADGLVAFVDRSTYSPSVYTALEAYYSRMGEVNAAKLVHIAGKKREREGTFTKDPVMYLWNWIEYVTTGYGKRLVRALLWSVVFIIIGCIVFWREEGMETKDKDNEHKYKGRYHPLWYSIATFLPIVKLPDADTWTPKMDRKVARLYLRLHIILGYLLIPLGLAAWTGIIK